MSPVVTSSTFSGSQSEEQGPANFLLPTIASRLLFVLCLWGTCVWMALYPCVPHFSHLIFHPHLFPSHSTNSPHLLIPYFFYCFLSSSATWTLMCVPIPDLGDIHPLNLKELYFYDTPAPYRHSHPQNLLHIWNCPSQLKWPQMITCVGSISS